MPSNPTNEQIARWLDPEGVCWMADTSLNGPRERLIPDFYTYEAAAYYIDPILDKHDIWRVRGNHHTYVYFGAKAYFTRLDPAIEIEHHPTACALALAKIMEDGA